MCVIIRMRTAALAALLASSVAALAQPADTAATATADGAPTGIAPAADGRRRAPLESMDEMRPAAGAPSGPLAAREQPAPAAEPAAAGATARAPRVMDTLDLGTTSITGNQELPKVLYIVPWKRSDLGELAARPAGTLLDEVLAPIDPAVFERHVDYYEMLYGTAK